MYADLGQLLVKSFPHVEHSVKTYTDAKLFIDCLQESYEVHILFPFLGLEN